MVKYTYLLVKFTLLFWCGLVKYAYRFVGWYHLSSEMMQRKTTTPKGHTWEKKMTKTPAKELLLAEPTANSASRLVIQALKASQDLSGVVMPDVLRTRWLGDQPKPQGVFTGLNAERFKKYKNPSVGKYGVITNIDFFEGKQFSTLAVPVYFWWIKAYKGMIEIKLCWQAGEEARKVGDMVLLEEGQLESAVQVFEYYQVSIPSLVSNNSYLNPFDFWQVLLPTCIHLKGTEQAVQTWQVCAVFSEVFRMLKPVDRDLFLAIMLRDDRFDRYTTFAASSNNHHHSDHGLLVHTAEVLLEILRIAPEYVRKSKRCDLSLTLLAGLLHDGAKADDYYRVAPNTYVTNQNCKLLGHEQTMMKWIAVACAQDVNYPQERQLQLEHAICAVRKQHDQSGVRKRKTPESFLVHEADCASARDFNLGRPSCLLNLEVSVGG